MDEIEKSLFEKLQSGKDYFLTEEENKLYWDLRVEAVELMKTFPKNEDQYVADTMVKFYLSKKITPLKQDPVVINSNFFPILPEDTIISKPPYYTIGIDTSDENNLAYCLCKNADGFVEMVTLKTMHNKEEFEQEVENLTKYFNADVLKT